MAAAHDDALTNNGDYVLAIVADGMGGTNCGEVASRIAKESVQAYFSNPDIDPRRDDCQRLLKAAIMFAHNNIVAHAAEHDETQGMGTTLVLGLICNDELFVAWSGDSRCYLFRNGNLEQISKDHSYVQTLVDEGVITIDQAFYHPQGNIILQSLGDRERPPQPESKRVKLQEHDIILLNTDGLNGMLEDHNIAALIGAHINDMPLLADVLITAANSAGGVDNTTLVLVKLEGDSVPAIQPQSVVGVYLIQPPWPS
ncbi:MAG: serine/threonine-protein phosphatase, partial [Chitinophagia bacterium]|nr:serine/threonine-protein phosphatase [Chitinophagia bacterium]